MMNRVNKYQVHFGWTGFPIALMTLAILAVCHANFAVGAEAESAEVEASSDDVTTIALIPTPLDHPPGSHLYRPGCELLASCLNQTPGVRAVVSAQDLWPEDSTLLEQADALVFYSRPAGDIVLGDEHRDQFKALLDRGVGYVAIHWATQARESLGQDYLKVLGGWFLRPHHSQITVKTRPLVQLAPEHPVCRGWEPYTLRDEFYLDLIFEEDAEPILKVDLDGREQVVAWAYQRADGGRSFGTTLGHFHDNFTEREAFRRAIVNGILWSAHVEIPEGGAPVELQD